MRAMRVILASCFVALSLQSPLATGAACAGFTDVDSADTFCPAVTWMKSRGVTLGCAQGLYCPNGNVTRLQMAGFMSRLQRVLPLTWVDANGTAIGPDMVNKAASTNAYVVRRTPGGQVVALPISTTAFDFVRNLVYFDMIGCVGNAYVDIPAAYPAQVNRWGVVNGQSIYTSSSPPPTPGPSPILMSYRDPSGACFPTAFITPVVAVALAEDMSAAPLTAPFHVE